MFSIVLLYRGAIVVRAATAIFGIMMVLVATVVLVDAFHGFVIVMDIVTCTRIGMTVVTVAVVITIVVR